jgi:hypothetical protein
MPELCRAGKSAGHAPCSNATRPHRGSTTGRNRPEGDGHTVPLRLPVLPIEPSSASGRPVAVPPRELAALSIALTIGYQPTACRRCNQSFQRFGWDGWDVALRVEAAK